MDKAVFACRLKYIQKLYENACDTLVHVFGSAEANQRAFFIRFALVAYVSLLVYPIRIHRIIAGLDPSWILALNYLRGTHYRFGSDVVWTYGPLGFLAMPLNIGNNLPVSLIVQFCTWALTILTLSLLIYRKKISVHQLFTFAICICFCRFSFDYSLCCLILILIAITIVFESLSAFVLSLVITIVLTMVKFSAAIFGLSAIVACIAVQLFRNRRFAVVQTVLASVGIPGGFLLLYYLYNPLFLPDVVLYLKGAFEISSGYSVAMSLIGKQYFLVMAVLVSFLLFALGFFLFKAREKSFYILLVCILPLFLTFKHGFVRQDGHIVIFFEIVLFIVGLLCLFTNLDIAAGRRLPIIIGPLLIIYIFMYQQQLHSVPVDRVLAIDTVRDIEAIANNPERIWGEADLTEDRLPPRIRNAVGNDAVGVFPWEITYIYANNLNWSPFPVLQAYSAYTPYLDLLNAGHLSCPKAPPWLLFDFLAIDDRHPLIDVPGTWTEIYRWYEVEDRTDRLLLLKRRATPRFGEMEPIGEGEYGIGQTIPIPDSSQPVAARIHLNLSPLGKLEKFLYRINPIRVALYDKFGRVSIYRVVPDTLSEGAILNFVPRNLHEADGLMSRVETAKFDSFSLFGEGIKSYRDRVSIEFYRIPGLTIREDLHETALIEAFGGLPSRGELGSTVLYSITQINLERKIMAKKKAVVHDKDQFITILGWAVDSSARSASGGVQILIDGKSYLAFCGLPSESTAKKFNVPGYGHAGFKLTMPISAIGPGQHSLSLKILTEDKKACYRPEENFVIEIK